MIRENTHRSVFAGARETINNNRTTDAIWVILDHATERSYLGFRYCRSKIS
jgi:hypothetical protein